LYFPPVHQANKEGIVAIGGDLSVDRLLLAYRSGIFPWFSDDEPIVWWSPNPRFVLFPNELKISKSMRLLLAKNTFEVTYNQCFDDVIKNCALAKRTYLAEDENATWITDEMMQAYLELHKSGFVTSVEVWQNKELVGGLYGVVIGKCFFGESMFHKVSNASKFGFIHLVEQLKLEKFAIIDCQVYTQHLESLGAKYIDRKYFLDIINNNI
jgi:leucyl/phenylalanyl-tRNA--protein transferase